MFFLLFTVISPELHAIAMTSMAPVKISPAFFWFIMFVFILSDMIKVAFHTYP